MFISHSPAPLPVIQATPESRVSAAQPVKAPNFANLLRQNRPAAAPLKPPEASSATQPNATTETSSANDSTPTDAANAPQRNRTASADKAQRSATKSPPKAQAHEGQAEAAEDSTRSGDTPTTTTEHPLLAHWMSHLQRPAESAADALARSTAAQDDAAADAADSLGNDATGHDALGSRRGAAGAGQDHAGAAATALAAAADAFAQHSEAAALIANVSAEAKSSRNPDALPTPIDAASATPTAAAGFAASVTSTAMRPAEPTAVVISTPVAAPDFSQMLGVQLSVLAKDGIHHAELHLNPADMGPVSVQIEMNGNQAHIDFGADVAATRQAIEAGLPELASALRDAGFTLSGGGVSQHPRGGSEPGAERDGESRRGGRNSRSDAGRDASQDAAAASSALRRNVALGGLDLYA